MQFHGICLITEDVITLANFYDGVLKTCSEINNIHTQIKTESAMLAIYSKSAAIQDMKLSLPSKAGHNILQFGVDDVDVEYERLKTLGIEFLNTPTTYPWGGRSMQFLDPDGNVISFASRVN